MKILYIAAEVAPFVSVGGLSQVLYFLPHSLRKLGHDVRIFTPKYGSMKFKIKGEHDVFLQNEFAGLKVPVESNAADDQLQYDKKDYILCNVKSYKDEELDTHVYFLENREYYELRANVFGYLDDHIRFGLLSRGCLEWLLQRKKGLPSMALNDQWKTDEQKEDDNWIPDIIHAHDWHTSYVIDMAKRDKRYKSLLSKTAAVLTVHNFSYQGNYDYRFAPKESVDNGSKPLASILSPHFQTQNALMRGLLYADAITTVSPTHAVEVLTPDYAEGMDATLQQVRGKLTGILNGIDTIEFNPNTDPIINVTYTEQNVTEARKENKRELQKLFMLPVSVHRPLFAFIGRLWIQKGLDILLEALPKLLANRPDAQMVVLGGGDDRYRTMLQAMQKQYPKQLGVHLQPNFRLPRKIFSGADVMIVPSLFEPGGIVALEALRYGAVPIVRRTGGLNDIIMDFDPVSGKGNGFSFEEKDAWALYGTMIETLTYFRQPEVWEKIVKNCLRCDYSWDKVATQYESWYHHVLEERRRAQGELPHAAYNSAIVAVS